MALPTSGAISLANLQGQYGGASPIYMSEYYRKTNNTGYVKHSKNVTSTTPEYYTINQYHWKQNNAGNTLEIMWNYTVVWSGLAQMTSASIGGITYYRGAYNGMYGFFYYYAIKRRTTSTVYLNQTVPTSGQISMSQFYGGTN